MAGSQDIRRRIKSVKNTQQVTKAMKMISAVKLRKSQERLTALRPYSTKLDAVVRHVVHSMKNDLPYPGFATPAFFSPRPEKKIHLVLVASDKGLCGGFNANVIRQANHFLAGNASTVTHFTAIGKRAADWARKLKIQPDGEHVHLSIPAMREVAAAVASEALKQYERGEIDALYVIFNYYHSAVSQLPKVVKLFPIDEHDRVPEFRQPVPHLLEPDPTDVLDTLLPKYIEVELLRSFLESSTSEHGARMAAMDKASTNAEEMIAKLTLHMNKIRQASITNQIIEIVSGANA